MAANLSNRAQIDARSFHNQRPECALLRLEHCSVALSLSDAVLYFLLNTHQERKTHAKYYGFGVI